MFSIRLNRYAFLSGVLFSPDVKKPSVDALGFFDFSIHFAESFERRTAKLKGCFYK